MELHDPGLYAAEGDGAVLLGARCAACGKVSFPRTAHGCPHCGAAEVAAAVLSGAGDLKTAVTIHQPLSPGMAVPMIIGRVALAEGPVEDGVVDAPDEAVLRPGIRMRGVLVPEERGGITKLAFRFRPVGVA